MVCYNTIYKYWAVISYTMYMKQISVFTEGATTRHFDIDITTMVNRTFTFEWRCLVLLFYRYRTKINNIFWLAINRTRLRRMTIAFGSFSHVGTNVKNLDSNFVSVFDIWIDTFVYCVFAHFSRNSVKRTWVLDKKPY